MRSRGGAVHDASAWLRRGIVGNVPPHCRPSARGRQHALEVRVAALAPETPAVLLLERARGQALQDGAVLHERARAERPVTVQRGGPRGAGGFVSPRLALGWVLVPRTELGVSWGWSRMAVRHLGLGSGPRQESTAWQRMGDLLHRQNAGGRWP
jgi:hypothetical protein